MFFGLGEKLSFLTTSLGRIFAWTPGDIYDASLNNWFLENNFQYFLKGGNLLNISKVFEANLYWPENNTLAMSDNWILLTPIYAIIRSFLSPNFAFTGIIIFSILFIKFSQNITFNKILMSLLKYKSYKCYVFPYL